MTAINMSSARAGAPPRPREISDPVFQAYALLRTAFVVAPILFGLDKFAHVLVHWEIYLAPRLDDIIPGTAHQAMHVVGVIEVVAGLVVAIRPRYGSLVVAGWLAGIIVDLLLVPGYYDIALRDFGLMLAALTLFRLASAYDPRPLFSLSTLLHSPGSRTPW
jgi:hypothetical protein